MNIKYALNLIDVQIIHEHMKFARLPNRFYSVCESWNMHALCMRLSLIS